MSFILFFKSSLVFNAVLKKTLIELKLVINLKIIFLDFLIFMFAMLS